MANHLTAHPEIQISTYTKIHILTHPEMRVPTTLVPQFDRYPLS